MSRECGSCTMCCSTMRVLELQKPPNTWCQHCSIGVGCEIYADRPPSCRGFECLWLASGNNPDLPPMDEELRPDKSKVVLSLNVEGTAITAFVNPTQEKAWRQGEMGRALNHIAKELPIIIICGDKRKALTNLGPNVSFTEEEGDGTQKTYFPKVIK